MCLVAVALLQQVLVALDDGVDDVVGIVEVRGGDGDDLAVLAACRVAVEEDCEGPLEGRRDEWVICRILITIIFIVVFIFFFSSMKMDPSSWYEDKC